MAPPRPAQAPAGADPRPKLALVILGGRNREPTVLPDSGKHILQGYKAVDVRIGGRSLIQLLVGRMRATKAFDPIFIAGPRHVYEGAAEGVEIIDTDGGFGENLRVSVARVIEGCPGQLMAVITGDVLPEPEELELALEDFYRHQPLDFWMPQIRMPDDDALLGESAWKPRYHVVPEGEMESVGILPGHLVALDPNAARLEFILRLFDIAYRTRNRSLAYRRTVMVRAVIFALLREDVLHLLSLRKPNITWTMLTNGLIGATKLKAGNLGQRELEDRVRRLFMKNRHRKRYPERRGRVPVLDALSLAKDIDTEEEALEIVRRLERAASP